MEYEYRENKDYERKVIPPNLGEEMTANTLRNRSR
jgi:hypothetical protein